MKQGEIWRIQFPKKRDARGHEYIKDRPAVIIESDEQIPKTSGITIVPITSNTNNCEDDDILIARDNYNNLFTDSVIKVHHMQTFDKSRVIKKIGKIGGETMKEICGYLRIHFDI